MSDVTKTNFYGPRELAPESLWPGLTRFNIAVGSWHPILTRAMGKKAVSGSGIWLPDLGSSESDLKYLTEAVLSQSSSALSLANSDEEVDKLKDLVKGVRIQDGGCWMTDSGVDLLRPLSEADVGHHILESDYFIEELRQCETPGCQYHRHYDFSFDVPSGRRELVYPNEQFYFNTDSEIITAWGDVLPPVEYSRRELDLFKRKSVPFVNIGDSLLTASGVSQICLIPSTGCWFVRSYYMTPTGEASPKGWQYDGYGRLQIPSAKAKEHNYIKYSTLAHRIVWLLSGRALPDPSKVVLNHMCGFRPCANPDHLEELSPQENNIHGIMMEVASKMLDRTIEIEYGLEAISSYGQKIKRDIGKLDEFWANFSN